MHEWITLTKVFGSSLRNPTIAEMETALDELFEKADADHPDAWIECGSTSGPLYTISIFSNGYALYTKYSDSDMSEVLESTRLSPVDREGALVLWSNLTQGRTP